MNKVMQWIASMLNHNKSAITVLGATVLYAGVNQLAAGRVDPKALGYVALATIGTLTKSAIDAQLKAAAGVSGVSPTDKASDG